MAESEPPPWPDHRTCQSLTGLTFDHLPRDATVGGTRRCTKGSVIWSPDDRADRVYFLKSGQVAVRVTNPEGEEVLIQTVQGGEPFGELCYCSEGQGLRHTVAMAVADSEIVEITLAEFLKFLQTNRKALDALVFTFCARLSDAERRLEALAQRGAEERLGRILLQLARTRGRPRTGAASHLLVQVSHDELAALAAMSRPHVTVTMGEFRRRGLVQYSRNQPVAVDVAALTGYLLGERWTSA